MKSYKLTGNQENRIRIKDIAERAHVSVGTVDRVIHERGQVAKKTRSQILAIVEELGYTPNLLAKSLASKKLYKIATLIPFVGSDNLYWEKPQIGIRVAADEIKDYNTKVTIYTFDVNSEKSFKNAFNQVLEEEPDGLIFTPVFYKASHEIIKVCEERKIPYIFIDTKLDACNNLAYFGQNAEQSGFLAAKLLHYGLPAESEVLMVKPFTIEGLNHHLQRREKGFLSFFLSASNTKKIVTRSLEVDINNTEELFSALDNVLNENASIKGIFIMNSRAFKVGKYLSGKKINHLMLIGYDLISENLDYLERGIINFLIGQKPEEQGYKSVSALFNHLVSGKAIDKTNYSPIDIIMKENIDYYKNYKF